MFDLGETLRFLVFFVPKLFDTEYWVVGTFIALERQTEHLGVFGTLRVLLITQDLQQRDIIKLENSMEKMPFRAKLQIF